MTAVSDGKRVVGGRTRRGRVVAALLSSALLAGCTGGPSVSGASSGRPGSEAGTTPGLTRFAVGSRQTSPVVEGPAVEGPGTVSTRHPGRVVVVNVWQSTCGPCRGEAAALGEAAKQTAASTTFVGLDVDDQQASALAFIRSSGTSYAHVYDPDGEQLLELTGVVPVNAIPSTLVIDRQGRVAARVVGAVSATSLIELLTDVASGR